MYCYALVFFLDEDSSLGHQFHRHKKQLIVSEDSEVNFLTISPLKYILGFSNSIRTEKEEFAGTVEPLSPITIDGI